ncbi:MAG: DUF4923 family protein [Firmicutes bacterium]|nr:DUF4923 family protein [Bacillota bacterium]MCM1401208.1 DUF4923 family protein [Bacteroides sp.]MCM1477095.1 DUF4923 family protein [Bacteroides sp.]
MKKILTILFAALLAVPCANAWNLKDALKGIGNSVSDSASVGSTLGSAFGSLLSTDKITLNQMVGEWAYQAPAVTFKSDNVLKKAGGAAASAAVVEKLKPIYQRTGFDKAVLTVSEDSTFQIKLNKLSLKGTISTPDQKEDSQANFVFNITVGGKLKVGKMETYVTKSASGNLSVMFDVSELIKLMETVGKISNNTTINSAVSLLKSYDGLCAGFEMKQTGKTSSK